MASLPQTYKAANFEKADGPLVIKNVELKRPGPGQVLMKVIACGVCGSDLAVQGGHMGNSFPICPGHEAVGDVAAIGENVTRFSVGDRIGAPWHGGHDNDCKNCGRGDFQMCEHKEVNGVTQAGGFAEYVLLRQEAVVRVPKDVDPAETAPLLCAGVTVFNSIRQLKIPPGELVAIQGLGGLGHLAVQFANKMGYRVAAISSGDQKRDFAKQLGAHEYIDSSKGEPAELLKKLGGAALIVATAPNPKVISPLVNGLAARGHLLILSPVGPVEVDTVALITSALSVSGFPSGHALDSEEAIAFTKIHGIKCMIEKFPFADAQKALDHTKSGKVRFRSVLMM